MRAAVAVLLLLGCANAALDRGDITKLKNEIGRLVDDIEALKTVVQETGEEHNDELFEMIEEREARQQDLQKRQAGAANNASDPCDSSPCGNGGNCTSYRNYYKTGYNYYCTCRKGITGKYCTVSKASGPCTANNPCQNGGMCSDWYVDYYSNSPKKWSYYCSCTTWYTGTNCSNHRNPTTTVPPAVDPCDSNPCLNGGNCSSYFSSYSKKYHMYCQCPAGFGGKKCEKVTTDPCLAQPCQNGGQCQSPSYYWAYNYYWCKCADGWNGKNCTGNARPATTYAPWRPATTGALPDPCRSSPCLNGGNCTSYDTHQGHYKFYCMCDYKNFQGKLCQASKADGPCATIAPCQNGGHCQDWYQDQKNKPKMWKYNCYCESGFSGKNCTFTPTTQPQVADPCNSNPCQNGGNCSSYYSSYYNKYHMYCSCPRGFSGKRCTQVMTTVRPTTRPNNPCNSNPCENGGTCRSSYDSYNGGYYQYCRCKSGFTGKTCHVARNSGPCKGNANPCQNGARCNDWYQDSEYYAHMGIGWKYSCQCSSKFAGKNCSEPSACNSSPCTNGGSCRNEGHGNEKYAYKCRCKRKYTGSNCELLAKDACKNNPCGEHGTCLRYRWSRFGYRCECNSTHDGSHCDQPKSESPCATGQDRCNKANTKKCGAYYDDYYKEGKWSYYCQCKRGFQGRKCDRTYGKRDEIPGFNGKAARLENMIEKLKRDLSDLKEQRDPKHEPALISEKEFKKHEEQMKKRNRGERDEEDLQDHADIVEKMEDAVVEKVGQAVERVAVEAASEDEFKAHQDMMKKFRASQKRKAPAVPVQAASEDEFRAHQNMIAKNQDAAREMADIRQEADELDLEKIMEEKKPDWLDDLRDI